MIAITVEAPDLGALERELEVVLIRLRGSRPTPGVHVAPSMPLQDPGEAPRCPDHPEAGPMTFKAADPTRNRAAAYWCNAYGCRQRVAV